MKILVLKRDKLGDLLLTTPMFARLRSAFPEARIELLASEYNAWVAKGNPHLDAIHAYPRVRIGKKVSFSAGIKQIVQIAALRKTVYDWIIVAQGEDSPRAVQRALWLKSARFVAYAGADSIYRNRVSDPLMPPEEGHEAQRVLGLLQPLGVDASLSGDAPLFLLPESASNEAGLWLETQKMTGKPYVVLGLGARRARKQPTTQQILRWVKRLHDDWGLSTVFMWTPGASDNPLYPGDDDIAQPVLEAAPQGLVPFRGPLMPALGLIWRARTSIFPDSGLMHFASASPGHVLGLFGDTPEFARKWAPLGPRSRHLVVPRVDQLEDHAVFDALAFIFKANDSQ